MSSNLVEMLEEIIETAIVLAKADFGNVQLLDNEGRLRIVAQRNFPEWWIGYWETEAQKQDACGVELAKSLPVSIEDVEQSPIFAGTQALEIQRRAGVRAVHSIPLIGKQKQFLGMFSTHYRAPHTPAADTLRVLDLLATHAATLVEHARDEHLLRENKRRLREAFTLLESATAGADILIATVDLDFRYTYFNDNYRKELGRLSGKNAVLGTDVKDMLSDMPGERSKALELWQRALDGETIVQQMMLGDARHYRRWYTTRHTPIRDASGRIIGAAEVTTDVTDRILTELRLQSKESELIEQRMLLESAMQTTDVMLVLLNTAFDILWVNEAYARSCGMQPAEMVDRNLFTLYPNAENETVFRQVRDIGDSVFYRDDPFEFPDQPERGTTYWDWSLAPVKNAEGKVSGLVYSLRETTPYKRTELALASSEQRYRSLAEQVPDGIFVADAAGRYTDVNQVGAAMLGYSRDEIIGLTIKDIIFPEEVKRLPEEIARFAAGSVVRSEWRFRRKDGSGFIGEVLGRSLPDGRLQGVLRDISERRQMEQERLAALARQRDALVREVHHRIKNHLHGMMGLLSAEAASHPALAAPLAEVATQIKAIATVYGMQASRKTERIELGQMVSLLVKNATGPVSVEYDSSDAPPIFVAETASIPLALVINELIVNALKHLEQPDPQRSVKVVLEQVGTAVRLTVRSGPAHLPDNFDFELQNKTGLGLELVGTLLPKPGTHLRYEQQQDDVCAILWLEVPVVRMS